MDKILQINDIIEPNVEYRGSVKILYIDKDSGKAKIIKRHNEGGVGLFTAICRALVGLDTNMYAPSYIYGYSASGMQLFTQKITYASTPLLYNNVDGVERLAVDATAANVIQYTFLVPITSLKSTSEDIAKLILYNNERQVCAELDLTSDPISTSLGANILIYWKLKFANPGSNN